MSDDTDKVPERRPKWHNDEPADELTPVADRPNTPPLQVPDRPADLSLAEWVDRLFQLYSRKIRTAKDFAHLFDSRPTLIEYPPLIPRNHSEMVNRRLDPDKLPMPYATTRFVYASDGIPELYTSFAYQSPEVQAMWDKRRKQALEGWTPQPAEVPQARQEPQEESIPACLRNEHYAICYHPPLAHIAGHFVIQHTIPPYGHDTGVIYIVFVTPEGVYDAVYVRTTLEVCRLAYGLAQPVREWLFMCILDRRINAPPPGLNKV